MKKNYFYAVILSTTVLLSACTLETAVEEPVRANSNEIGFAFSGDDFDITPATRATTETTTTIRSKDFNLFGTGVYDGTSAAATTFSHRMTVAADGTKATIASTDATPTKKYYWPVTGTPNMKFFGVYPFAATGGTGWNFNSGPPNVTRSAYAVNSWDTPDLLYVYQPVTAKPSDNYVALEFAHALTKVTFSLVLKSNATGAKVKVTSVALSNLVTTANFTLNTSGVAWSAHAATTATVTASGQTAREFQTVNVTTGNDIWTTGGHFTVMPVNGHPSNVTATIKLQAGTNPVVTKTLTLPTPTGSDAALKMWEPGRHINYTLEYYADKDGGELLFGGITVADWGTQQDIPVPIN